MKPGSKTVMFVAVVVGVAVLLRIVIGNTRAGAPTTSYSQFLQQIDDGEVAAVTIAAAASGTSRATYRLKDGSRQSTVLPANYADALRSMHDKRVNIEIQDASEGWTSVLVNASPFFVLVALWLYLLRRFKNHPRSPGRTALVS